MDLKQQVQVLNKRSITTTSTQTFPLASNFPFEHPESFTEFDLGLAKEISLMEDLVTQINEHISYLILTHLFIISEEIIHERVGR